MTKPYFSDIIRKITIKKTSGSSSNLQEDYLVKQDEENKYIVKKKKDKQIIPVALSEQQDFTLLLPCTQNHFLISPIIFSRQVNKEQSMILKQSTCVTRSSALEMN